MMSSKRRLDWSNEGETILLHRETATKTNSLIDRVRKLTLPAVDDVREGLASYRETTVRVEELEAKIDRTDALIDEASRRLSAMIDYRERTG